MRSAFKHIYVCERVGGGEFTFGVETYKASIERVTFRLNLKEGRREMAFSARHAPFSAWWWVKAHGLYLMVCLLAYVHGCFSHV